MIRKIIFTKYIPTVNILISNLQIEDKFTEAKKTFLTFF